MKQIAVLGTLTLSVVLLTSTPALSQDAGGTLKKIKDSGAATMGVRESSGGLSFTVGDGKFAGFHVELCQRALADVQKQLGMAKLDIKYQPVTSQNRIPLTQNGTVDIECGSTSNTAARKQQVAFALTTYITEARFAVKAASGIEKAEQLRGKTIVTTTGTTLVQRLRKLERQGLAFNVVYGKDHADSFLLVEAGRADAFAMDDNTLAGNIAAAKNPKDFRIVGEPLGVEPIAIMLRRDDPKFKAAVDGEIRRLMASGELEKLYARWFTQPILPAGAVIGIPFPQTLKAAFQNPNDDPAEAYEKE